MEKVVYYASVIRVVPPKISIGASVAQKREESYTTVAS